MYFHARVCGDSRVVDCRQSCSQGSGEALTEEALAALEIAREAVEMAVEIAVVASVNDAHWVGTY